MKKLIAAAAVTVIVGMLAGAIMLFALTKKSTVCNCSVKTTGWVYDYIASFKSGLSADQIAIVEDEIQTCAKVSNIAPELLLAWVKVESNFNPNAISPEGAIGLTQIMPSVWNAATFDIRYNIRGGCRILISYITKDDLLSSAFTNYNGGGKTYAKKIFNEYGKIYQLKVKKEVYGDKISKEQNRNRRVVARSR